MPEDNVQGVNAGSDTPTQRSRTKVVKTASTASETARNMAQTRRTVIAQETQNQARQPLTENEMKVRAYRKFYATTNFGFNSRQAYSGMASADITGSSQGNFYSPQLSTDFLEKPQNLRERRAWYRTFYNSNEFVGQAIDLHSTLPISKIKLDKPKSENQDYADYIYEYFVEMCNNLKLTKCLLEMSHEYYLMGNCVLPWSIIKTNKGYKQAEDIKEGDFVLTDKGRYRKIIKICSRPAEEYLKIRCHRDFRELDVTGEHPIEVFRNNELMFVKSEDLKTSDYIRITWPEEIIDVEEFSLPFIDKYEKTSDKEYSYTVNINHERLGYIVDSRKKLIDWLSSLNGPTIKTRDDIAKDLNINRITLDNIISSLNKEIKQTFHKRIGAKGFQKGSQVVWYPIEYINTSDSYEINRTVSLSAVDKIKIDNDFCYLAGYWLGDGTLARDSSRDNWGRGLWQIAAKETCIENINRIKNILFKLFDKDSITEWNSNGMYYVKVISNPAFIEWWSENFGETSFGTNNKKIPEWFEKLPKEKLLNFIAGVIDSDGCVSTTNQKHIIAVIISMSSFSLMLDIKDICLKCNLVLSFNLSENVITTPPNSEKEYVTNRYKIQILDEESCYDATQYSNKTIPEDVKFIEESKFIIRTEQGVGLKIKSIKEEDYKGFVHNFEVEEDHTYQVEGFSTHNCWIYSEDHDPYSKQDEDGKEVLKEKGRSRTKELFEKYKIIDKDPNYEGFKRLIILPPDQIRIKKVPLSDDILVEFIPDPETKKTILGMVEGNPLSYDYKLSESDKIKIQENLPEILYERLKEGGAIPLDTDPYSGSHVYQLSRKKSQYETYGVSILERCVNTLLYQDKLRQAQTSIASRHMTPIRLIWLEGASDNDVDVLREQVDMSLVDPDYSIITNQEVHWEEMGVQGRLMDLTSEFEHIENSLFAGLGVTREILTGEGTYSGNRINLEILNTQYLLFREQLQDFVENNLFKPVAKKKGFEETDKFGRKRLLYPKLSFARLAVRDNDAFFDQAFNLYNKSALSIDIIHDMMNVDTNSTKKKLEADLFTVNDSAFNQLTQALYNALGPILAEKYNVAEKLSDYFGISPLPVPPEGAPGAEGGAGGAGGLPGLGRFSSGSLNNQQQQALNAIVTAAIKNPQKLDKIFKFMTDHRKK